jgi:hypothetical protein
MDGNSRHFIVCYFENGLYHSLVTRAATDMARQHVPNLSLVRLIALTQETHRRHQDSWCAKAALKCMMTRKALLESAKALGRTEPLNRFYRAILSLHRQHQAGSRGSAINQDSTCATNTMLATDMRTVGLQSMTQEVCQLHARFRLTLNYSAI